MKRTNRCLWAMTAIFLVSSLQLLSCKGKNKDAAATTTDTTIPPSPAIAPAPAPVVISADDSLTKSVNDAIKDYPGVSASVKDGEVTLTGDIKRAKLQRLMMDLHTLKPRKITNKLTIK